MEGSGHKIFGRNQLTSRTAFCKLRLSFLQLFFRLLVFFLDMLLFDLWFWFWFSLALRFLIWRCIRIFSIKTIFRSRIFNPQLSFNNPLEEAVRILTTKFTLCAYRWVVLSTIRTSRGLNVSTLARVVLAVFLGNCFVIYPYYRYNNAR